MSRMIANLHLFRVNSFSSKGKYLSSRSNYWNNRTDFFTTNCSCYSCKINISNNYSRCLTDFTHQLHEATNIQEAHERLMDVCQRLDDLDATKSEAKAGSILDGLGFTRTMQHTKIKDVSGGWRMRIALARALILRLSLMLLDEPTNHLEEELKTYSRILTVASHSQDFLNGVCTKIVHMHQKKLKYFGVQDLSHNLLQDIKMLMDLLRQDITSLATLQLQLSEFDQFGHGVSTEAVLSVQKRKEWKRTTNCTTKQEDNWNQERCT